MRVSNHFAGEGIGPQLEAQVMVVGKIGILVQVRGRAIHLIGRGPAAARHQIKNAVAKKSFVVVDMPADHHRASVRLRRDRAEIVGERLLIRPRVVVGHLVRLHIGHGRMMHDDQHQTNRRTLCSEFPFQPNTLLAAGQQRGIAVERQGQDPAPQCHRIPAPAAQLRKFAPPAFEAFGLPAGREFVVAERRVDPQALLAPLARFRAIRIVIRRHPVPGQIPVDE